jgi:predicted trehalose synthase
MAEPNLELLQAMTQRVLDKLAEHDGDFHAIRERLTAIERHLAGVRRDAVLDAETTVNVQAQVDRLGDRIGRIERRLDLADAST